MQYNIPGRSDLHISEIGFGCMSLQQNEAANTQLIHRAVELGINFFDTADLYNKGMNETALGKAVKEIRQKIIIATKAGNQWRPDGSGWDWNPTKKYILTAAEKSLQRLQTDYIDLYQLHGGTINDPIDETIEAFELLKQQGKIRHYGISSIRPNVIREYVKRSSIVTVMMQYSLLDRRPEESILELLSANNISLLCRGALAQGLLVNKPAKEYLNYTKEEVQQAAKAVQHLSGSERSAAQTAIQFVLANAVTASAVIGIRTMQQLEEAVQRVNAPHLTSQQLQQLRQSVKANQYEQHR